MRALHVPGPSLSIFSIHDLGFSAFFCMWGNWSKQEGKAGEGGVGGGGEGSKKGVVKKTREQKGIGAL